MALELQYMLGTSPETAAITLYGFMQQNILFDAFSGFIDKIGNSPLDFLKEITTMFSMIGMLVLIFSPSLWKAKYLISWTFLFVAVTLGGATGNTFGYDFNKASGQSYLNKDVNGTNLACKKSEELDKGVCNKELTSDNIAINYLGKTSIAEAVAKAADDDSTSGRISTVQSNDGKSQEIENLKVIGFFPQVYIIYATNRFRTNLEAALFDLNSRSFPEKSQQLQTMLGAQTPNPQLDMWIYAFDKLCSSKTNADTASILSSGQSNIESLASSGLLNQRFTVGSLVPLLLSSSIIEDNNTDNISPIMDIYTPSIIGVSDTIAENNKAIMSEFLEKNDDGRDQHTSGDDAFRQYTINYPLAVKRGFFLWSKIVTPDIDSADTTTAEGTTAEGDTLYVFKDLNKDKSKDKIIKTLEDTMTYKLADTKAYLANGKLFKTNQISSLPADLVMAKFLVSKTTMDYNKAVAAQQAGVSASGNYTRTVSDADSCMHMFKKASCALGYMQSKKQVSVGNQKLDQSRFVRVPNCGVFLNELSSYYTEAMVMDNNDYSDKLEKYPYLQKSGHNANISRPLAAQQAFLNEVQTMGAYCAQKTGTSYSNIFSTNNEELNKCTAQYINPIVRHYQQSAIGNSLNKSSNTVSKFLAEQGNSLTSGLSGVTYSVGKGFTDFWTSAVVGLGTLKNAFNAGAYAKILPIIKNILVAFILICTPILFLIGLLVPAWAPGVIATSIITILFLQMTDVIMVVVQSVLIAIEKPLYAISQTSSTDSVLEYQAFMEYIWGIAYMSTFAITAFLMFAAGNTKAIMSKMAGLDGNIKSVSQDIYKNGWALTKQGVGMLAPGMGNSLVSSTGAFKTITGGAAGLSNVLSGKSASTSQEWSHAYQSAKISGINENDGIKSDTKKVTDTVRLHSDVSELMAQGYSEEDALAKVKPRTTSKMMNEHKKEKGIKAFSKDLESSMTNSEGLGLYQSDRIKKTDEHGKDLRKANLLSGKKFGNTTYTDTHGVRQEAAGIDDQTAGLEKFAAENGWNAKHIGATQAQIYKNIDPNFEPVTPGTQYQEFKDGKWNSHTVEHSNMKLHSFKNREQAIANIQKSGASRATAEAMLNQIVKFRTGDEQTGFTYHASKVSDTEGQMMKDPDRQAKGQSNSNSSPAKSRNSDRFRRTPGGGKGSANR